MLQEPGDYPGHDRCRLGRLGRRGHTGIVSRLLRVCYYGGAVSTFMHPNGPEPSSVYWIRRAAILVVLLTVVLGLWWLFGAVLGGDSTTSTSATSTADDAAVVDTAAEGVDVPAEAASAAPLTPAEPVGCPNSVIRVEATTDSSTYTVGETPRLTLSITNTGDVACTRDVGPKANELEITSGGYHVWSSDDCNASNKSKISVLEPGQTVASAITWNGRLSQKGCPDGKGAKAKAGRYDVQGRNGKVKSDPTPFALRDKKG